MNISEADAERAERAGKLALLVMGLAIDAYLVWMILPAGLKAELRARGARLARQVKEQRHNRGERRRTAFEVWLITQAIEEYNTTHDIDTFRTKLGVGPAPTVTRPGAAGLGQTEDR